MSQPQTFEFKGSDGAQIAAYRWRATSPRVAVQIAHGMGEHALRYGPPFAPFADEGIEVFANDHRGHGKTAAAGALGDFGAGGFGAVVDDMAQLSTIIRREYPQLPIILIGHSMGSFAAQIYLLKHSGLIDGAVLSGSAALDLLPPPSADGLEAFNAPFEPARTKFDWLSRDAAEVDKYVADPLCGFSVTPDSMVSLFTAAAPLFEENALTHIRSTLPVYFIAGDKDPLNGDLTRLQPLVQRYRQAGIRDVRTDFYPGGRHEMFNETNREEVMTNLLRWIERVADKTHKT